MKLGFKNIVLFGVDLVNTDYFWEDPSFDVPSGMSLPTSSCQAKGGMHSTNNLSYCPVTIEDAILNLYKYYLSPLGISLSIVSDVSPLSDKLPKSFQLLKF